jgi:glycosyltransferase involved in cell wall biosynthesis
MGVSKPFFSVVMPTRDRAQLLPFAIRSVLDQTFVDFEIIVSDNFSLDSTAEAARSFGDERVKYFRSRSSLSINESWEFALSHATGQYVTFLSDDDAYAKVFLERLFGIIESESAEVVSCVQAVYFATKSNHLGKVIEPQSLKLDPFDRRVTVLEKADAVKSLFGVFRLNKPVAEDGSIGIPQLVNSAYKRSLIQHIQTRIKNIFSGVACDIYSSALFLNFTDKYCFINEPLYLHAEWSGSTTADASSFFDRFPSERELSFVPLKSLFSFPNLSTNYILRAVSDLGDNFIGTPIEWRYYFSSSLKEICYMEANGRDTVELRREFDAALEEQDEEVQQIVRNAVSKHAVTLGRATSLLKNSPLGGIALRLRHRNQRYLSGFDDISDCASQIDEAFLVKYAEA